MPSFYPEGSAIRASDDELRALHKLVSKSGGFFSGSGSPEGVQAASPGSVYVDTDAPGTLYFKRTGTGNTGWV